MTTKLEQIIHLTIGMALFLVTLELFLKKYLYTRSENEIITRSRGEGLFTPATLSAIFIQLALFVCMSYILVKIGLW